MKNLGNRVLITLVFVIMAIFVRAQDTQPSRMPNGTWIYPDKKNYPRYNVHPKKHLGSHAYHQRDSQKHIDERRKDSGEVIQGHGNGRDYPAGAKRK